MRGVRLASAALCLAFLAACGSPPATPMPVAPAGGTSIHTRQLTFSWDQSPSIVSQSILAASDLDTLRAVVDAMGNWQPPTGSPGPVQCRPPYVDGHDACWPGARSQPGRAYLALAVAGGFCEFPSRPQLYLLPGRRLVLLVGFSRGTCYGGAAAAPLPRAHLEAAGFPHADLVSISTTGLPPGLYAVSYRFVASGSSYDSDPTYLSVPGPATASQSTIEAEATAVLAIGQNGGTVSLARVAGDQVGELCGETEPWPAFLLTTGLDLWLPHRQVSVVLAGPTPHTCAVTSI